MHYRPYRAARNIPATAFREVGLATAAYFVYFLVRGFTEADLAGAQANAHRLIRFEKHFGFYHEAAVQDLVTNHDWLINLGNWVYIWGHWPVIIAVGTWLLYACPARYRVVRTAFLVSGGIGLVIFATFPVAPPRLADIGLADTVTDRSHAYRVLQPPIFVNQYAAMPSLHFGWDLLIGITLVATARSMVLRVIGVLLPLAMAFAVVSTANHFIIDAIAGGALALFGLAVALWWERGRARASLREAQLAAPREGAEPGET